MEKQGDLPAFVPVCAPGRARTIGYSRAELTHCYPSPAGPIVMMISPDVLGASDVTESAGGSVSPDALVEMMVPVPVPLGVNATIAPGLPVESMIVPGEKVPESVLDRVITSPAFVPPEGVSARMKIAGDPCVITLGPERLYPVATTGAALTV